MPRDRRLGRVEFIAMLALAMAIAALGIDLMLPAFPAMRRDFGLAADSTAVAGVLTTYFLGLAIGQVVYGPLADRFGRRPAMYVGCGVYAGGALVSLLSPTLPLVLASRFVWGMGAAGPRVVTLAVIRDSYEGEAMSRAMSFVMAVFIMVPVVAPTIGASIVSFTSWRWLFGGCLVVGLVLLVWTLRLPETLREEHRLELRMGRVVRAARQVASNRHTVAYTLAMTLLYGAFIAYLGSAEIVFGRTFRQPDLFPYFFGALASVMGLSMLLNARIVRRVGTRRLAHVVLLTYVVAGAIVVAIAQLTGGRPPLGVFLAGLAVLVGSHALLIPNFNTIAMAPMGAVAGIASSLIGATQIAGGAVLGSLVDGAYDGTVRPLVVGFFGYGVLALLLVFWAERGRLFAPLQVS